MRKAILFFLLPLHLFAQRTEVNLTTFSSVSPFTNNGATANASGGVIHLSGGTNDFTKYLSYTSIQDNDCEVELMVDYTLTATGNGIGVSRKSVNTEFEWSVFTKMNHTTGAITLSIDGASVTSSGTIANTVGASYRISLKFHGGEVIATAYNLTAGTNCVASVSNNTGYNPNTAMPVINTYGGSQDITAFKVIRTTVYNPHLVFMGDSKTWGAGVAFNQRYAALYEAATGNAVEVFAGTGDKTAEALKNVDDVIAIAPQIVVLNIGRNDLAWSISSGTWQSNYASIVSQLEAAGITVFHLMPIGETSQDQSSLASWITANYPGNRLITVSSFNTGTMLSDGIHPNVSGHQAINTALQAVSFPFSSYYKKRGHKAIQF